MANISIITNCNRRCSYCFAGIHASRQVMRLEHYARVLDLLEQSGHTEVRLLGGEPTLHSAFPTMVSQALARRFSLTVFSNGLMPEAARMALARAPADQCSVLLNVPCPPEQSGEQRRHLEQTCRLLRSRAGLGINVYRPGLPLQDALDLINLFGLKRIVRLGLAHPCLDAHNEFLHPRSYRRVGRDLLQLARRCRQQGVELTLDCGFVPCMFDKEFYELTQLSAEQVGHKCGPIPDLLPDLSAIHCYALGTSERHPLCGAGNLQQVRNELRQRWAAARSLGIFRECGHCELKISGRCAGGCLAAALLRRNPTPLWSAPASPAQPLRQTEAMPQRRWALPYIDQLADFWGELASRYGDHVREVYFPLPLANLGSGRPPQPANHLAAFLGQDRVNKCVLINAPVLFEPVERIGPRIVAQVVELVERHGITAATVSDVRVAEMLKQRLPGLRLAASVLLDVCQPFQAVLLRGLFDVLVPSTRILRDLQSLRTVREAFAGPVRLLVNEACLPGCPYRRQHFHDMAFAAGLPQSLCSDLLARQPWLRLTGAWVLPQHLHWFDPLADEYKLAGRATLHTPADYFRVLDAYVYRTALRPNQVGGGPASVLTPEVIPDAWYQRTLTCGQHCHECDLCRRLAKQCHLSEQADSAAPFAAVTSDDA